MGGLRPPWADTRQITNYHTSLSRPYQHPTRLYVGTAKRKKKRRPRRESRNEKRDTPRSRKRDAPRKTQKDERMHCMDMMHVEFEGLRNSAGDHSRRMRRVTTHTQKDSAHRVYGIKDARPIAGHRIVMMFIMAWDPADCRQPCKSEFNGFIPDVGIIFDGATYMSCVSTRQHV